jgi:hypothetical protein
VPLGSSPRIKQSDWTIGDEEARTGARVDRDGAGLWSPLELVKAKSLADRSNTASECLDILIPRESYVASPWSQNLIRIFGRPVFRVEQMAAHPSHRSSTTEKLQHVFKQGNISCVHHVLRFIGSSLCFQSHISMVSNDRQGKLLSGPTSSRLPLAHAILNISYLGRVRPVTSSVGSRVK